MRTLVDIPEDDILWLDREAAARGKSRTALVRDAVRSFRAETSRDGLDAAFGSWAGDTAVDAVEQQRRSRAEWARPWDPEYAVMKAEFPDLFADDADTGSKE